MNIVVCIKQVPEVTDADLEIREDGRGLYVKGRILTATS